MDCSMAAFPPFPQSPLHTPFPSASCCVSPGTGCCGVGEAPQTSLHGPGPEAEIGACSVQLFQACVESKPEGTGPGADEEAKLLIKENLMMKGWCLVVSPSSPASLSGRAPQDEPVEQEGLVLCLCSSCESDSSVTCQGCAQSPWPRGWSLSYTIAITSSLSVSCVGPVWYQCEHCQS